MQSPEQYQQQIERLDREATEHKREERRHRRAAQEKRQQRADLIAFAAAHGIPITHEAQPRERHSR